jgi:hypothetical protein
MNTNNAFFSGIPIFGYNDIEITRCELESMAFDAHTPDADAMIFQNALKKYHHILNTRKQLDTGGQLQPLDPKRLLLLMNPQTNEVRLWLD